MVPPQQGDEAELYESYNPLLARRVRAVVRGVSEANVEDACAFAWMQFLRHQPDRDRNWRAWLATVASREALQLHRREAGHVDPDRAPEPVDRRPSPQLEHFTVREALMVVAGVPQRRREAAVLRLVGLKYTEIAEALGVSPSRVNRLLDEASADMRKAIAARNARPSPRADRLSDLERNPPLWLLQQVGRPPSERSSAALLAWRRAALAVDDYRAEVGEERLAGGLGDRPLDAAAVRRYDRARITIERLKQARLLSRGRAIDR
jgi:RNA polymerase sigma factor (sigma-70 family)